MDDVAEILVDLRERMARVEQDESSVHRRLDNLEALTKSIQDIALEMKTISADVKVVRTDISTINERVNVIEQEPKKRYNTIITALITGVVSFLIGFLTKHLV